MKSSARRAPDIHSQYEHRLRKLVTLNSNGVENLTAVRKNLSPAPYGRGDVGRVGTPLPRSLSTGRGDSKLLDTLVAFGRGDVGRVGTPLANAIAAFVAATAKTVITNERNRRAFFDITPP